jgi:hypothetical protein
MGNMQDVREDTGVLLHFWLSVVGHDGKCCIEVSDD